MLGLSPLRGSSLALAGVVLASVSAAGGALLTHAATIAPLEPAGRCGDLLATTLGALNRPDDFARRSERAAQLAEAGAIRIRPGHPAPCSPYLCLLTV